MRLKFGYKAPEFDAIDYTGEEISLGNYKGKKVLLSFFRYAACPYCNLRVHKMINEFSNMEKQGLHIISIFQSPSASIEKYVGNTEIPFPIIGDPGMKIYKKYGVEISVWAFIKMLFRIKDLWNASRKGLFKLFPEGPLARVPADFLIDENGIIIEAFYGKDSGDHLPFKKIYNWINTA